MPASSTATPSPPASTTPASASRGSRVGVRSVLACASSTATSSTTPMVSGVRPFAVACAASAASRITVSIVPSTGCESAS